MTSHRTRRAVLSGIACLGATAGLLSRPAIAQNALPATTFDLKVSTFLPGQDALVAILREWTDTITQRTNGQVRFTYFPSSQMGPIDRQFDLARTGVADVALFIHGNMPGRFPMTELAYLPGTFSGVSCERGAAAMQALADFLAPEHAGTKLLAVSPTPEFMVFSAKGFPNVEALVGQRIRNTGRPMVDALRSIGAVPVGIPTPEMADALHKGLVDGLGINWQAAADWRVEEVGIELLAVPLGSVTFCIVMNQARIDAMPEPLRRLIDETSADLGVKLGRELDTAEAAAEAKLRPLFTIATPERDDLDRFRARLESRREAWLAGAEARGMPAREYYARLTEAVRAGGEATP